MTIKGVEIHFKDEGPRRAPVLMRPMVVLRPVRSFQARISRSNTHEPSTIANSRMAHARCRSKRWSSPTGCRAEPMSMPEFSHVVTLAEAGADVALLHNTILPNFGTMIRWRAHAHVIRQPVGWFESDFAGRIANKIIQAGEAIEIGVNLTIDAAWYALVFVVVAIECLPSMGQG